jgi:hypothetical protein
MAQQSGSARKSGSRRVQVFGRGMVGEERGGAVGSGEHKQAHPAGVVGNGSAELFRGVEHAALHLLITHSGLLGEGELLHLRRPSGSGQLARAPGDAATGILKKQSLCRGISQQPLIR